MANTGNLRPFSGANNYRRQNGRRKGSKNLSTIVDELLGANIDLAGPINEGMKRYLQNSPTTYAKAIALAMIIKAINGDVRAATWVSEHGTQWTNGKDGDGFFSHSKITFQVVPSPRQLGEEG